jgi:hypothetical protein
VGYILTHKNPEYLQEYPEVNLGRETTVNPVYKVENGKCAMNIQVNIN